MEYKNGHIDFYTLTVGDLLNIDNDETLVINGFIFFPSTYIKDLKTAEIQCLFDKDTLEDVVKKYSYEIFYANLGEIKCDIRYRLRQYVKNEGCVMHLNKSYVTIWTRGSIQYIERNNFDSAIRAITGREIIV